MDPEFVLQAQRLEELRIAQLAQQQAAALGYTSGGGGQYGYQVANGYGGRRVEDEPLNDPLIFPGIYAPSGFDIMDILIKIYNRPNPTINIGNIDQSVALTLCEADTPDMPIVYCSEPFQKLVGYHEQHILGRNCRFLQTPPKGQKVAPKDRKVNETARKELKEKLSRMEEACVQLINYTSDGRRFLNVLTIVPITWDDGKRYVVGFQADATRAFG